MIIVRIDQQQQKKTEINHDISSFYRYESILPIH